MNLPTAPEQERAILGAVFVREEILAHLRTVITKPEMFFDPGHMATWEAMLRLADDGRPIDYMAVLGVLQDCGKDKLVMGISGLAGLDMMLPDVSKAGIYAEAVVQAYRRRQAWHVARKLSQAADVEANVDEVVSGCRAELDVIADLAPGMAKRRSIGDILEAALPPLPGAEPRHLSMFCRELTKYRLFSPGRLILLAGRPGHGKSALALHIADHVAHVLGKRVLHLSLEMRGEEIAGRLLTSRASVDYDAYQDGLVSTEERVTIGRHSNQIEDMATWLLRDRFGQTVESVCTAIRHEHSREPLALVIIDYLGLVQLPNGSKEVDGLGEIARVLKVLSEELGPPILALHQMNRGIYSRAGWTPQMDDLRGSGKLEEHADAVVFVSSPYQFEKDQLGPDAEPECPKDEIFLHIRKNRGGRGHGDVPLYFFASRMQVRPVSLHHDQPKGWK